VDSEPLDGEVIDPRVFDLRYQQLLQSLASLLDQVRRLNPNSEEVVKTFSRLLIDMGEHNVKQFKAMSERLEALLAENGRLCGVILEMQVKFQSINVQLAQIQADATTKQRGISAVESVAGEFLKRVDPEIFNSVLREVLKRTEAGA